MTQEAARRITERLLGAFGLTGWSVRFVNFPPMEDERRVIDGIAYTRPRRRLGLCSYRNQTIDLSIPHVEQDADHFVTETIAEEVAHALTPGDTNHGPRWKRSYENIKAILVADAEEQKVIASLLTK
jgi:hypothetical protein